MTWRSSLYISSFPEKKMEAQSGKRSLHTELLTALQSPQWLQKPGTGAQTLVWKMGLNPAPPPTCCVTLCS